MVGGRTRHGLPVNLYHWITGGLGLLFVVYCSIHPPLPTQPVPPLIFSLFLIMHVIASFLHFQYTRMNVVITFGSSFVTAALLVFGTIPAVYIAVTGIFVGSTKRMLERRFLLRKNIPLDYEIGVILFNTGMVAWMWFFAGWIYTDLFKSQIPLIQITWQTILSIFVMFIGLGLLNVLFIFFSNFLSGQRAFELLKNSLIPAFCTEFATIPFGVVMALSFNRMGNIAFILLSCTLLLANIVLRRLSKIRYDLEEKLRHLTSLNRVSKKIISVREEHGVMNLLFEEMGSVFETDSWFIAKVDPWRHLQLLQGKETVPDVLLQLSTRVLQSGQPVLISNATKDGDEEERALLLKDDICSCMAVPVVVDDRTHMILNVYSSDVSAFKKEHMQVLIMVADETALALQNARLYSVLTEKVDELEHLNQELRQVDRLKSEFLSNVSHELRTPLTSIKGYVEYMKKEKLGPITPMQNEGLSVTQRNIMRLQRMINDLLDYTKLEFKKAPIELRPCRLENIWADVYEQYAEVIEKRNLDVQVRIQDDLPFLFVDVQRFTQVLRNLLSNAIKFSNDQARIIFRAQSIHHPGPFFHPEIYKCNCIVESLIPVEITMTDEGIGISDEAMPRIFERFYQVDSSHTREYGGTGLGLALVKSVLEAHGIPIEVQSKIGHGTSFGMVVPSLPDGELTSVEKPVQTETLSTSKYLT